MSKEQKKLKGEEAPPLNKRSMVSENDLVERIKTLNKSEEKKEELIPDPKILQLFMAEKLYDMDEKLGELLTIFKGAKVEEKDVPTAPSVPTKVSRPPTSKVDERVAIFDKFGDDVTVDVESSAQFILVKPKGWLADKWQPIMDQVKELGGTWVEKGKQSFWQVPKLVEGPKVEGRTEVKTTPETTSEPLTGVDSVKASFSADLCELLTFEEDGKLVVIRPLRFLGADNFAKIASVVRSSGGEYVSAGKNSHFKIPLA